MHKIRFFPIFILLIVSSCTTISGHKVVRTPDGGVKKVVNVKGMPIAVQTPTMAMFILTKSTYRAFQTTIDNNGTVSQKDLGEVIETTLSEKPIFLGPSEIYTIDPKRPAAGSIDYDMDFENQYPKKIKGKVEDATIEQLRALVKDLVDTAMKAVGPAGVPPGIEKEAGEMVEKQLMSSSVSLVMVDLVSQKIKIKDLN